MVGPNRLSEKKVPCPSEKGAAHALSPNMLSEKGVPCHSEKSVRPLSTLNPTHKYDLPLSLLIFASPRSTLSYFSSLRGGLCIT